MPTEWTDQDEALWNDLDSKSFSERSVDEEMAYKSLGHKRNYLQMTAIAQKKAAMRKAGPFHKPAVVFLLLGLGSCGGACISWSNNADRGITGWWFAAVGIGLLLFSAILNGLNGKITGADD